MRNQKSKNRKIYLLWFDLHVEIVCSVCVVRCTQCTPFPSPRNSTVLSAVLCCAASSACSSAPLYLVGTVLRSTHVFLHSQHSPLSHNRYIADVNIQCKATIACRIVSVRIVDNYQLCEASLRTSASCHGIVAAPASAFALTRHHGNVNDFMLQWKFFIFIHMISANAFFYRHIPRHEKIFREMSFILLTISDRCLTKSLSS